MTGTSFMKIAGQVREAELVTRPLAEIIADLSQPIAPEDLGQMKKGGATLTFIPWYRAVRYLDRHAPGWSYEVRAITPVPGSVALTVRITIPCAEGLVYREATGIEEEEVKGYGDPTSNAESMALRRAAAKFGLGLYLYEKGNGGAGDTRPAARRETEPVRNVKLAGVQPTNRAPEATPADTLRALNRRLGFNDAKLLKWVQQKFQVDQLLPLKDALESLGPGEMSMAIDLFTKKLEEAPKNK